MNIYSYHLVLENVIFGLHGISSNTVPFKFTLVPKFWTFRLPQILNFNNLNYQISAMIIPCAYGPIIPLDKLLEVELLYQRV